MDPNRRSRLRDNPPEIAVEAKFVVFGVLLAVNDWRDARDNRDVAAQARQSIAAEITENRADSGSTLEANRSALREITERSVAVGPDSMAELSLTLSLAQLSSTAFDTAQSAGAASGIEFVWLFSAARAYDLQELYERRQELLLDYVGDRDASEGSGVLREPSSGTGLRG